MTLSPADDAVLHYVRHYVRTHDASPTPREIAKATHLASTSVATAALISLEQAGYLTRVPGTDEIRLVPS